MEHLNSLQAYVTLLQTQIETQETTIRKLNSRLDEGSLNFKYDTLLESYNDAERENKALKRKVAQYEGDIIKLQKDMTPLIHSKIVLLNERTQLKEQIDNLQKKYYGLKEQLSNILTDQKSAIQPYTHTRKPM